MSLRLRQKERSVCVSGVCLLPGLLTQTPDYNITNRSNNIYLSFPLFIFLIVIIIVPLILFVRHLFLSVCCVSFLNGAPVYESQHTHTYCEYSYRSYDAGVKESAKISVNTDVDRYSAGFPIVWKNAHRYTIFLVCCSCSAVQSSLWLLDDGILYAIPYGINPSIVQKGWPEVCDNSERRHPTNTHRRRRKLLVAMI